MENSECLSFILNHLSYIYWPPIPPSMSSLTESPWILFSTWSSSGHLASNHLALLRFSLLDPPLLSRHRPTLLSSKATSYTYRCPLEATRYAIFLPHVATVSYIGADRRPSKVVENPRYTAPINPGRIFEDIEELLSALSRRYEQRRSDALFAQLERLS